MNCQSALNVLLIGKGAREHALAWKLAQSPKVKHVFVCPGNGGTDNMGKVSNVRSIKEKDYSGLVAFAKTSAVGLVVVGPDDAVVDGIEAYFRGNDIPCFAPTKEAAEIEGSKAYSKAFMLKYGIPTADYRVFDNYTDAQSYLDSLEDTRVVIKVDGLAAGKGVIVPSNRTEAKTALREILVDDRFGQAGCSVVIEEFLEGKEVSLLSFCDGETFMSLPPGQDHKRIYDGNQGPNTGGMGVYAPLPFVSPDQMLEIERTIVKPTLDGLREEGRTFTGMLFTGIMLTAKGPKVLEYNAKFGDPETQTMMMLLAPECDLADILLACCEKRLSAMSIPLRPGFACNVVVASGGYPDIYSTGESITIGNCPLDTEFFHAGTERTGHDALVTAGGRVISVASYGASLEEAVALAYQGVKSIDFKGMFYRRDIAKQEEQKGHH